MSQIDALIQEYQKLTPFRLKYKEESRLMQFLNIFVIWFCPDFMTQYTTVVGHTIYLPSIKMQTTDEEILMRTIAHEVVHILDSERWSLPVFISGYLFPQILAAGIILMPFIGLWALLFLLFLLPLPSGFRLYFESRAYAIDVLTASKSRRSAVLLESSAVMTSWSYYSMHNSEEVVQDYILHWVEKAEHGKDQILSKVLLVYEMVKEMYEG